MRLECIFFEIPIDGATMWRCNADAKSYAASGVPMYDCVERIDWSPGKDATIKCWWGPSVKTLTIRGDRVVGYELAKEET